MFEQGDNVVVDPTEERLRDEFEIRKMLHLPMQCIVRIEEVDKRGPLSIRDAVSGEDPFVPVRRRRGGRGCRPAKSGNCLVPVGDESILCMCVCVAAKAADTTENTMIRRTIPATATALLACTVSFAALMSTVARAQDATPRATPARNDYAKPETWLCHPGNTDACSVDLTTTVIAANGALSREPFSANANAPIDCFYVSHGVARSVGQ